MPRGSWIILSILGVWLGVGVRPVAAAEDFVFHHENVMGTSLELRVRADDADAARRAEARVLREIDSLSKILSGYDKASEFSRWQSAPQGPTKVSTEFFELLQACDLWRIRSGGAFDPRVHALTRLWSSCAKQDRIPTAEEMAAAKLRMSQPAWRLDPDSRTAERLSDGPLTLDAIAKGYIVERACEAALRKDEGVRGLLLNVGGDLRVCGEVARTTGIADPLADSESSEPFAMIEVKDRAVATSGRSQRGLRIRGRWYSHIFDPRSGLPADAVASATVIAPRSADADALATIFNVLKPEESLRLAGTLPGVECLIVTTDGRTARSDGWGRYEKVRPSPLALDDPKTAPAKGAKNDGADKAVTASPASWGDEFELVVDFEINRPDDGAPRYRRPYVAVWVEDKEGRQARTLALFISSGGAGPFAWLPDLKRWYRSEQARIKTDKMDVVDAVSRPTRPPGKYKVIWDGKDNHGKPLGPGEYTIHVEAAREHGTYQSIRQQVAIADKPFSEELKGNVEIKSASIEYRRKTPAK